MTELSIGLNFLKINFAENPFTFKTHTNKLKNTQLKLKKKN